MEVLLVVGWEGGIKNEVSFFFFLAILAVSIFWHGTMIILSHPSHKFLLVFNCCEWSLG